ncbi:hypothetical protein [Lachnoclostridium sp. Marseille-P6806]|uniref:hypothetical protein n=1 Tax=Lachnoclostridium sp. Marseille-P6806 TaxID=2364793 RepID=UPI0010310E65|nr:hypothetical protein [Lachnoclostridium sp. Marseille-P6806]
MYERAETRRPIGADLARYVMHPVFHVILRKAARDAQNGAVRRLDDAVRDFSAECSPQADKTPVFPPAVTNYRPPVCITAFAEEIHMRNLWHIKKSCFSSPAAMVSHFYEEARLRIRKGQFFRIPLEPAEEGVHIALIADDCCLLCRFHWKSRTYTVLCALPAPEFIRLPEY